MIDLGSRWHDAALLLAGHRDVLDRPLEEPALSARGWSTFLLSLDDAALAALETGGLDAAWPSDTPASLLALLEQTRGVCALPGLVRSIGGTSVERTRRHERPRKQAQVDAFARLILPLATTAARVLDIGSGHGHLTREIAERVAVPVVGLERDATLAQRARGLTGDRVRAPSFTSIDVLRDGVVFASGDCVIGLHACGELGDVLVTGVAASRADTLALVGCCLQKQRAPARLPLCTLPASPGLDLNAALALPKDLLGLSNLTPRDHGVEASRVDNLAGRERRVALHRLLSSLAPTAAPRLGSEMQGLNRRAAQLELPALVARACELRSLPPPSTAAIDEAASWAREQQARARRLQLPRTMLARALEVFVLLDRARFLEERGFMVEVGIAFPASVSARNLALLATRR